MRTFEIRVQEPGGVTYTKQIAAAYFSEEDQLIVFKDTDHKAVYAIRYDCLISAERVEPAHEDQKA
ncbi:hypothetical protein ACGF3K_14510 [Streptomyces sp. NPDC047980]|uniref:hypothetical protein n=1 Tax=Streptomyces sp. NPDC047980 TaxID=3365494 RepID=UPI00371CA191